MKKLLYFFLVACLFWCCDKEAQEDDFGVPPCEEQSNVEFDKFCFNLFVEDYTYPILVGVDDLYDEENVKLFNEDESVNITFTLPPCFQAVSFPRDSIAFSEKVIRNFYLQLDSTDTDTIRMDFKLHYKEGCDVVLFESLDIFYNDSLYNSSTDIDGYTLIGFTKI